MTKKRYFGTDGIRGRVGEATMNPEFALKLGWAAGKALTNSHRVKVLIGKDTRLSGYLLESALQSGLSSAGVDVHLLGPMPTPAIAHLTHSLRAQAGIVISASHNSYQDNGIKFFDQNGCKLSDELELAIEAHMDKPLKVTSTRRVGKLYRVKDAAGRYIEFCKSIFPSRLNLQDMHLSIDCAHGAGYFVGPAVFEELGAKVYLMGNKPNGININHQCGATDVKALQTMVMKHQSHCGIALDGDGDRLIMVDDQGEVVDGDELLCILALHPPREVTYSGVVGTVMSNLGLEQALNARDIAFTRAPVGDRHVLAKLREKDWSLGGESSGHIVNLHHATTGDGIITALQILAVMQRTGRSLHALKQLMVKRPQILINVPINKPLDLSESSAIMRAAQQAEKGFNGTGRVLLRASGTEPLIRVMVEGNDVVEVERVAEALAEQVELEAKK